MPCYQPTPLVELPELAVELGVAAVLVKDESHRLSLPAFKILGASWAVNYALSQRSGFDAPATCLTELRERSGPVTLVTATDGNHGRAVARMAALLGLAARIYIPAGTAAKYAFLRSSPHLQPTADRGLPRTSDLAGQVDRQPSIARYEASLHLNESTEPLLSPDPARARVRVYATHSTHKTLTALRQGSMIHVYDQDFALKVAEGFHEAYMAHTSTSPNYQILASLDLGRRQAALEGFELVQRQLEYAMKLRDAIDHHPLLSKYMHCLSTAEMIPERYRASGIAQPLRPVSTT